MTKSRYKGEKSSVAMRRELAARLRGQGTRMELAIRARFEAVGGSNDTLDLGCFTGTRGVVAEAVRYGLESLEKGDEKALIPVEMAKQARRAAQVGLPLATILRHCAAGSRSFEEFVITEGSDLGTPLLGQILGDLGLALDRLMELVAAEYQDELERVMRSSAQKRTDRIVQFLESGRIIGPDDVDYDFDGWHVGLIHTGHTELTARTLRAVADRMGYRLLALDRGNDLVWAWFGCPVEPNITGLIPRLSAEVPQEASVAIGEPRYGVDGWRQSFSEARAAFQVMFYRPQQVTRCRDVILVSAVMRDPALTTSLIETFLAPLDGRRDSGKVLRETLRAYFRADQNANTAAAALGVARHTVERRLRSVEQKLGQTLDSCDAQLQVALGVEELIAQSG